MIQESTYDIYIRILINREKKEAKKIFCPKTVYQILNEMMHEVLDDAIRNAVRSSNTLYNM